MATFTELRTLFNDADLKDKVAVALIIQSQLVTVEAGGTANHTNRLKLAKQIFQDADGKADDFLKYVLAANKAATIASIQSATEATIQANVAAAFDTFADGS